MINRYTHKELTWVDLQSPTLEEVRSVMKEYGIAPMVAEELLVPSLKPKVDLYKDYIYLILHFPAIHHTHGKDTNQEVDFIIGKKFLITTRYDTVDPLHKFSKVFEVHSILDKSDIGEHAGFIFFYMIKKLYKALTHELDFITDKLKIIEGRIFLGNEKQMVFELSRVSRELLQFKQALNLHDEVLSSFEVAAMKFFGDDFDYHIKGIMGAFFRARGAVEGNTDTLNELRETNNSLVETKQNENMRVLALISFIMLPLSLIASLFGMNTTHTPLVDDQNGFYQIVAIMAVSGGVMIAYFKYKKLL